jgi:dienelactone hydrolase
MLEKLHKISQTASCFGRMAIALAVCAICALPATAQQKVKIKPKAVDTFVSGEQKVNVWKYEPMAPGKYPAIVLLYGIDGVSGVSPFYGVIAEDLAARGYVVHMVHYFDRTPEVKKLGAFGLLIALRKPLIEGKDDPKIDKMFREWMAAAKDGIGYARKQENIDGERINLVGVSLGGFVTMSLAVTEPDLKLCCIGSLFGGLPRKLYADVKDLPPTLIIHGDKDSIVPVKEAVDLIAHLKAKNCACENKIYPGAGHGFMNENGDIDMKQAEDAKQRALKFLEKHVKPAAKKGESRSDAAPLPELGPAQHGVDRPARRQLAAHDADFFDGGFPTLPVGLLGEGRRQ